MLCSSTIFYLYGLLQLSLFIKDNKYSSRIHNLTSKQPYYLLIGSAVCVDCLTFSYALFSDWDIFMTDLDFISVCNIQY